MMSLASTSSYSVVMSARIVFVLTVLAFVYQIASATFSCEGRVPGYYADVETGCRTYHYCIGNKQYSYECPNNTLFQQRIFICNHWYLVDCESSERFYNANLLIGQKDKPFVGEQDGGLSNPATTQTEPKTFATFKREKVESVRYQGVSKSNLTFDVDEIQRIEKKTVEDFPRPTHPPPPPLLPVKEVIRTGKSNGVEDDQSGFIKLIFSDPRGLFYIPNDNNSLETISPNFREFLIPKILDKVELMQFKNHLSPEAEDVPCPRYCHPRFIKPGTCHPCIMIK